jgi:predicted Fe-Mo cluster-binding NifX family protein
MKLIISAQGPEPSDEVDPRFGRAPWFIVHDTATGEHTALDNMAQAEATQGAGVQAARNVVASGAAALLTGRCGPKAYDVLSAAGVRVYSGISGTVADAVAAWQRDELEPLASPDGSPRH